MRDETKIVLDRLSDMQAAMTDRLLELMQAVEEMEQRMAALEKEAARAVARTVAA